MKVCPECGRSYAADAVVCAYDGMPLSAGNTAAWEPGQQSKEPAPGDVLGQYRIIDLLARGGMGVIYRAQHVRLGRQVALKVLKPSLVVRSDVVERFFTEARAVNEIGHPNIVDVIDFVEVADQQPPLVYMVMELLAGQDLARRIRTRGPLDPAEAVAIADRVADALAATHRRKILHRDLKPENVFLAEPGEGGPRIKLLDFGIASAFGEKKEQRLTDPGSAVGTPAYMAPEQVLERELDERTDIYALGVLLYEMLTGAVPFAGSSSAETLMKQVQEQPEPVGRRRRVLPPVPPLLEQVVMTCLQKDPRQRYQNMGQVRAALASAVDATAPSLPRPRAARPRWPLFAASSALLLAAAGVGGWLLVTSGPRRESPGPAVKAAAPDLRLAHPDRPPDAALAPDSAVREGKPATVEPKKKRSGKRRPKDGSGKATKKKGRESTVDPFKL
jgi:eukaryotic-like serine/threonine-protein kinase